MLPTTPLQHLLLADTSGVLIATSGNAPDEPMARTEEEALATLQGLADAFLVHDRTIHTRVDDSIARVVHRVDGPGTVLLRRARGFVPDPLPAPFEVPPVLALGAELKNTVCLGSGTSLHVGQHIGDLKSPGNQRFFADTIGHLRQVFDVTPATSRTICTRTSTAPATPAPARTWSRWPYSTITRTWRPAWPTTVWTARSSA